MTEMFQIMKDVDKIGAVQFINSVRTRGNSLRAKKMRVGTVLRQGRVFQSENG